MANSDTTDPDDIVEIVRQRLADGRHVADHDVLRLIGIIYAYKSEIERFKQERDEAREYRRIEIDAIREERAEAREAAYWDHRIRESFE